MTLILQKFVWNYLDSNMYLLKNNNQLLVIDPIDSDKALKNCKDFSSITVLLTHEHFDHISGLNKLRTMAKCNVIAHKICSEKIIDPKSNMSVYADTLMYLVDKPIKDTLIPFSCAKADLTFSNCYLFNWTGYNVELFYTPGHSAGSVCIVIDRMLFSGDTLLENGLMTRFPGGSTQLFQRKTLPVLQKILKNVDVVFPGHGFEFSRKEAILLL